MEMPWAFRASSMISFTWFTVCEQHEQARQQVHNFFFACRIDSVQQGQAGTQIEGEDADVSVTGVGIKVIHKLRHSRSRQSEGKDTNRERRREAEEAQGQGTREHEAD
eukprot:664711-Pelagomonas_calceolata.AAC.6